MAKKKSSGKSPAKAVRAARPKTTNVQATAKKAAPAVVGAAKSGSELDVSRQQAWNFLFAGLLGVQAAIVLLLSTSTRSFPVTAGFLSRDPLQSAAQGQNVLVFAVHHLFDINIGYLVAFCLLAAAITHVLLATRKRLQYEANLVRRANPTRWHAYALVGGLLVAAVGMLAGAQDLGLLVSLFGLTAVAAIAWEITERSRPFGWLSFGLGKAAGALAWLVVGYYLLAGVIYGSAVSALVYVAFGVAVLAFAALAVLVWMAAGGKGRFASNVYTERIYMILGLVSVSTIGWLAVVAALK